MEYSSHRTHHDGSVVDEDIDPAESLNSLLNNPVAALLVSDVLGKQEALLAGSDDELFGLFGVDLLLWEVDDGDLVLAKVAEGCGTQYGNVEQRQLTSAPSMAYMTAAARPIPESPPVTIAFFPRSYRKCLTPHFTVQQR